MSTEPFQPQPFGRYHLEKKLAQGGMAEIFLATSHGAHGFEKRLVLKRILPEHAREERFVEWFIEEARLMTRLEHPKVVQVLDFGEVDGQYFIAMEYVKGIDCLQLLRTCAKRRWRPAPIIAVHIMADVLDALHYAHTLEDEQGRPLNIVHCDVSPSNIFISELGEVKLSDFGIATIGARRGRAEAGYVRGKYGYLAPEVISGQPVDHRADVFSAGVVLAELLMVQRLFRGKNYLDVLLQVRDGRLDRLNEFGQHIHPELRQILNYALARDPYLRYQDAADFRDALYRYLYERQQLLRSTSIRRFMKRMIDAEVEIEASTEAAFGPDARPAPAGPAFQHGRRHILLGPPPRPAPVPQGRDRADALARLSVGEPFPSEGGTGPGTTDRTGDFPVTESLPSAPSLPSLVESRETDESLDPERAARRSTSGQELVQPVPDEQWDLRRDSLVSILFRLAVATETGLLVLREGSIVKEIYLYEGDPHFVASNVPEELFGQFLLGQGVLSEEELERALAILPRYDGRLGESLVALRLLRPMQMLRLLTRQVRQKVLNAFVWHGGIATYYGGLTCDRPAAPLGLDAFELLEAGVGSLAYEDLSARLEPAMELRPRAVNPPPVPPEVFRVGGYPREVYDQLTGERTLMELLMAAPREPASGAFMRMAYLLIECGLAVLE